MKKNTSLFSNKAKKILYFFYALLFSSFGLMYFNFGLGIVFIGIFLILTAIKIYDYCNEAEIISVVLKGAGGPIQLPNEKKNPQNQKNLYLQMQSSF